MTPQPVASLVPASLAPRPRRLTTAQIGRRYGKSAKTVRRWIKLGKLSAYRTDESSPHACRYECDEAQLLEFERTHWRLTRPPEAPGAALPDGASQNPAA